MQVNTIFPLDVAESVAVEVGKGASGMVAEGWSEGVAESPSGSLTTVSTGVLLVSAGITVSTAKSKLVKVLARLIADKISKGTLKPAATTKTIGVFLRQAIFSYFYAPSEVTLLRRPVRVIVIISPR